MDTGPASCKWPLAGRSTHPQWTLLLPQERAACSCCLPANTNASRASAAVGRSRGARPLPLCLGFPNNHCVPELLFTLSLLAVPGTAFSGFSAFVSGQAQSLPLPGLIWDQCFLSAWVLGCNGYKESCCSRRVRLFSNTRIK